MARDDQSDEVGRLSAEVDALAPYLGLAREIRREVERFATDDSAEIESLTAALDAIPGRERATMARTVFERLAPVQQWAVLERLFGDDELRAALEDERTDRLAVVRRDLARRALVRDVVADGRLDLRRLPDGAMLSLGLFRPQDVVAAIGRGRASDVCARLLVLRATQDPGVLRVMDDVFNPRGALFVAAAYDQAAWQREHLDGHAAVRVGSMADDAGEAVLEPAVYLGARVDIEVDGTIRAGLLHLGFALLGDHDVFAASS